MLKELIRYTELADKIIIDIFKQSGNDLPQSEALFSHILNAQEIWLDRILGRSQRFQPFTLQKKADFESMHLQNIRNLNEVLSTDLTRIVKYFNSKGDSFASAVADILLHVVNHSTYHRGQVVSQFKQNGITPPVTDYIFLKRDGKF